MPLVNGRPYWIKGAIRPENVGKLRRLAEKHGFITHKGTQNQNGIIELDKTDAYVRAHMHGAQQEEYLGRLHFARVARGFR